MPAISAMTRTIRRLPFGGRGQSNITSMPPLAADFAGVLFRPAATRAGIAEGSADYASCSLSNEFSYEFDDAQMMTR